MQTANENIQQSFKSESAPCIKLLKKESTPKKKVVFLNESLFDVNRKHLHNPHPLVGLFSLVWKKMQMYSVPLGAAFGALKAHKPCFK